MNGARDNCQWLFDAAARQGTCRVASVEDYLRGEKSVGSTKMVT